MIYKPSIQDSVLVEDRLLHPLLQQPGRLEQHPKCQLKQQLWLASFAKVPALQWQEVLQQPQQMLRKLMQQLALQVMAAACPLMTWTVSERPWQQQGFALGCRNPQLRKALQEPWRQMGTVARKTIGKLRKKLRRTSVMVFFEAASFLPCPLAPAPVA